MPGSGESLFQFVCRHAELVKAREYDLGAYPGDGPTAEQAATLIANLQPVNAATESVTPATLWNAFKSAVDTEMTWLFPEKDAIGGPMTEALREVQKVVGKLLEKAMPEEAPKLYRYVDLSLIANAASRQAKLNGNKINWRLALARLMWWLGGGKRS